MNWKLLIFSLIFVFFIVDNIDVVFGATISYSTISQRLTGAPTYCIVEPPGSSSSEKQDLINMAHNAVANWKVRLQDNTSNPEVWEMNSKTIRANTNDESCDITIYFVDALESYSEEGIAPIGRFYTFGQKIDVVSLNNLGMTYNVILHEMGHSLGLGHYVSDNNLLNKKWSIGSEPSPSIMIASAQATSKLQTITGVDAFKVFEIYGSKGFYAFSPDEYPYIPQSPNQNTRIPVNPIHPFSPIEHIEISDSEIIVSKYNTEVVKITGQIKKYYVSILEDVLITVKEPGFGFSTHRVLNTDKGYFELPMRFDTNSKKGWYSVEVSYRDQSDYTLNFQFYVSDKPWNPTAIPEKYAIPEPETAPDTRIMSGKFMEDIRIVADNSEYEVKAYLKNTSETESGVRITAENACPLKNQIFQKDFRYSTGNKVSFTFYQSGQGKPDECSVHFTVSEFGGKILNVIIANPTRSEKRDRESNGQREDCELWNSSWTIPCG